ncbi:hypothetical protein JXA40_02165 [bacterium]|nr:hypothetical protein [candidate division CSSED10-310 bacterium]
MKKHHCPPVPMTITRFSRDRIELKSTSDASVFVKIPSIAGIYLLVIGSIEMLTVRSILPGPGYILALTGALILYLAFRLRRKSWEIIFDGSNQIIHGLLGYQKEIPFSDVLSIFLIPEADSDLWRVEIELKDKSSPVAAWDYPMDVARMLGHHLSYVIARPLKIHPLIQPPDPHEIQWELQYKMPKARFPAEWMVLAAAAGALTAVFFEYSALNLFSLLFFPRWLLIMAVAVPGAVLAVNALDRRGVTAMAGYISGVIAGIICSAVAGLKWPACAAAGLIAPAFFSILLLNTAMQKKRSILLWIALILCASAGLPLTLKSVSAYYSFRQIDPGIIEKIIIQSTSIETNPKTWILEKPFEIRAITIDLGNAEIIKSFRSARSRLLKMELVRPFGPDSRLIICREGTGQAARVILEIWDDFWYRPKRLAVLSSADLDLTLTRISEQYGFWPPEY